MTKYNIQIEKRPNFNIPEYDRYDWVGYTESYENNDWSNRPLAIFYDKVGKNTVCMIPNGTMADGRFNVEIDNTDILEKSLCGYNIGLVTKNNNVYYSKYRHNAVFTPCGCHIDGGRSYAKINTAGNFSEIVPLKIINSKMMVYKKPENWVELRLNDNITITDDLNIRKLLFKVGDEYNPEANTGSWATFIDHSYSSLKENIIYFDNKYTAAKFKLLY